MRQIKHIPPPEHPPRLFPVAAGRRSWLSLAGRLGEEAQGRGRELWRTASAWDGWRDGRRWIVLVALAVAAGLLTLGLSARRSATEAEGRRTVAGQGAGQSAERLAAPQVSADGTRIVLGEGLLRNIRVVPATLTGFRLAKEAIGQIAFNEDRSTPVYSPYSGRVVRLLANPGDRIARGAPLFEIASPDAVQVQSDYIAAVSQSATARRQRDVARRNAERQADLYEAKAVSQRDYDQAQADLQSAEGAVTTSAGQMSALRDKLRLMGKGEDFIRQLETERRIDPITVIGSPISGTVTSRKVGPGQYVQPDNTTALYTVADLTTMWLRVNVPETDIRFVKMGQQVQLRVMAYPNETFAARVTYIGVSIDPATRRVPVRAEIANPDLRLKPEMFATARILADEETAFPTVPVNAIVRDGPAAQVWVQAGKGEFVRRTVTLGAQQDGWVQITAGLGAGERVVSDGAVFLGNIRPGDNG
jgi:cobalt-zinc-cadmium efflux system membrane fusion protein